ncbi:unnamed protein product [Ilex paraguariensis]|uniref:Phytocyanin domain-containing protein n=1 Tax=Ilex paraguariensis TaxID=185542 RepID=A0ABC8TPE5_9AQUA
MDLEGASGGIAPEIFQYSSYNTVDDVTKESYQGCNTTNAIQSSNNGNTTYTLSSPGDRYFIAGNKLYCLGGMKLHVTVEADQVASPASAPEPGDSLPTPTSENNNPSIFSSAVAIHGGTYSILFVFLGFMVAIPWVM